MNPFRQRKSSLPMRSAYTLLELMLALALLGALMTVAWSLMGTFRDAEQRGWKLSHRTQTIRAAREWLQSDIQHLLQSEPSVTNSPAIKSRLNGNTLGFTASIAPSLNPLPFLENVMSNSLDNPSDRVQAQSIANPNTEAALAETQTSLWPAETMDVEYQLTPIEDRSATTESFSLPPTDLSSVQFSLTRREMLDASAVQSSTKNFNAGSFSQNSLADRVLTAQDLYRQTDETTKSNGMVIRETRLDGLTNVKFQYFDGQSWVSNWNSGLAGGLPRAIALCFDFPTRANMKPIEAKSAGKDAKGNAQRDSNNLLNGRDSGSQLSFADAALAAEPSVESPAPGESGLMRAATHEVQIVIYVGGQTSAKSNPQTFGSQRSARPRGGFE